MPGSPEFYWFEDPPIIVDDSDPAIRYNGIWNAADETHILGEDFTERTPMYNTLHVLPIFNGSLSYNFTGGGISVFATPIDSSNYTVQCLLNDNILDLDATTTDVQLGQSRPVCNVDGLPDGVFYTISVLVSIPERDPQASHGALSGFAFDFFIIKPPSGATPWYNGNQDVYLSALYSPQTVTTDPTLNFGLIFTRPGEQIADVSREWGYDSGFGFRTATAGSQFNLSFTGTAVWWYGYRNETWLPKARPSTSPTFSIDGGMPTSFTEYSRSVSTSQAFHFKTPVLPYGTHLLTVVYNGDDETPPLTLQSLIIQKSTMGTNDTSGSSSLTTASDEPGKLKSITCGIGGGVAFLLLLAAGLWLLKRRRHRGRPYTPSGLQSTAAITEPFPVPTEGTVRNIVPRKARISHQNLENPVRDTLPQAPLLERIPSSIEDARPAVLIHSQPPSYAG